MIIMEQIIKVIIFVAVVMILWTVEYKVAFKNLNKDISDAEKQSKECIVRYAEE